MKIVLGPMAALMLSCSDRSKPRMSDVMATMDVMPITTPSTVSPERILLTRTVSNAITITSLRSPTRNARSRLLTAQRLDGIQPRGTVGRVKAEEEAHERGDDDAERHGPELNRRRDGRQARDAQRDGAAQDGPHHAAKDRQHHRFGEHLHHDVPPA